MMETGKFMIRPMRCNDAAQMHQLHTECVRRLCRIFYAAHQIEAWLDGRSPEGYVRVVEEGGVRMLVAEQAAQIVGFASWRGDEFCSLYVHPDFNGEGVGSALYEACAEAAQREGLELAIVDATLNSKTFYERFGYREVARRYNERSSVKIPVVFMRIADK